MFYLIKMAIRNVGRNKRRTILTLSAVFIATIVLSFSACYLKGILEGTFDNYIRLQAGHIKIYNAEYVKKERLLPLDVPVNDYEAMQKELAGMDGIDMITPRIRFGVMLNVEGNNENSIGIGIDPIKERNILQLEEFLTEGSRYFQAGEAEMLIGKRLADTLGVKLGDTITVITQTAFSSLGAMNFKVVGMTESGIAYLDKSMFYIPIDKCQELLDMDGMVTELVIMTEDKENANRLAGEIATRLDTSKIAGKEDEFVRGDDKYEVIPWQSQSNLYSAISSSKISMAVMSGIILIVASLTILNTMLMSVFERTREIGMMMAMGMKGRRITTLLLLEALAIGVLGGIAGCIVGGGISILTEHTGLDFSSAMENIEMPISGIIYPDFEFALILRAFAFGIAMAVVASLYPAYRASRMQPTEALRAA